MAASQTATQGLDRSIDALCESFPGFTSSLISLYYMKNDIVSKEDWFATFNSLQEETAQQATEYFKKYLNNYTKIIENIDNYFDEYKNYEFEVWVGRLDLMVTKLELYEQNEISFQEVVNIMKNLEKKLSTFHSIEDHLRAYLDNAKQQPKDNKKWVWYFACNMGYKGGKTENSEEVASSVDLHKNEDDIITLVKFKLIPFVSLFIQNMLRITTFFSTLAKDNKPILKMAKDITADDNAVTIDNTIEGNNCMGDHTDLDTQCKIQSSRVKAGNGNSTKAMEGVSSFNENSQSKRCTHSEMVKPIISQSDCYNTREVAEKKLREHYKMMKEAAFSIQESCNRYYIAVPHVESDLLGLEKIIIGTKL